MPYRYPWLIRGSMVTCPGTVLRGHPFSGAAAASGAGCSGAVAAPLPCGPVPALKLRHCHATTLFRGTSAPATCRQPSSGAVQSGGAHALAALPAVAKICKARRSRQVCHWGRLPMRSGGPHAGPPPPAKIHENMQSPQAATVPTFRVLMRFWLPMRSGGPHAGPPPPAKIHENMQSPQAATVPTFRVLMRFWLPIRPGGLPYAGAVPMPDTFPHTFSRPPHATTRLHISPYVLRGSPIPLSSSINPTPIPPRPAHRASTNAQPTNQSISANLRKSRIHTSPTRKSTTTPARPWRASNPAETGGRSTQMRIRPTYSNSLRRRGGAWARHRFAMRRRRRCDDRGPGPASPPKGGHV